MGKKLRFWTGVAVGAAIQYFYDPKAGEARRSLLRERISDRLLDVSDGSPQSDGLRRIAHLRLWRGDMRSTASRI